MLDDERRGSPSGVVTFLFTDIEGSTRRWEADAETMRAALETHNEVLRKAVKSHQLTRMAFPEINTTITHLREVLGDETYESFARRADSMTNAGMATYALEQIDRARAQLSHSDGPS